MDEMEVGDSQPPRRRLVASNSLPPVTTAEPTQGPYRSATWDSGQNGQGYVQSPVSEPSSPDYTQADHVARPVSPLLEEVDHGPTSAVFHPGLSPSPENPLVPEKSHIPTQPGKITKFATKLNGWWWWETAAAFLSVACMVLLLVLLLLTNGTALEKWPLPIQPSSLIAVLTTVAKTSMMVPVAACLSQLKWSHYYSARHADKLHSLQLFDDASRGPWGSTMMIISVRRRAVLAWALAFVTVVALGIDPSAQQVLDFPVRTVEMGNVTAVLGRAQNYWSRAFPEGTHTNSWLPNEDIISLQAAVLNAMSGHIFQPTLDCPAPAVSCVWPTFTTLGLCSDFKNVTDISTVNCTGDARTALSCTYDFPEKEESLEPLEMVYNSQPSGATITPSLFNSTGATGFKDTSDFYLAFAAVRAVDDKFTDDETPPRAEVFQARMYWCARTLADVTATPTGLDDPSNLGSGEELIWNSTFVGGGAGASYDIFNGSGKYKSFTAPSTRQTYNITNTTPLYLFSWLGNFLTHSWVFQSRPRKPVELETSMFLYATDLHNMMDNIAAALTNQLRSLDPGDNNAADNITGKAFAREVFIEVRWAWLVLPMVEVVLVAVLLAGVVIATRREPLVKESVVAYFVYGTQEVRERLEMQGPVTGEEMGEAAKKVDVRLVKGGDGRLRLAGG